MNFKRFAATVLSVVTMFGAMALTAGTEVYAASVVGRGVKLTASGSPASGNVSGAGSSTSAGSGAATTGSSASANSSGVNTGAAASGTSTDSGELRGVWFSYLDWQNMTTDEAGFKAAADQVMSDIQKKGMNAIFCHVHSHSDAYYPSSVLPTSKFLPGSGRFDALQYMIDSAHRHGLRFHAWFNPYRVTGYQMKWSDVPAGSIVKQWYASGSRNVLLFDGNYYLNPAQPAVRDLVVSSIREVLTKYAIDGVQFDDYFYPDLGKDAATNFDYPEYQLYSGNASITEWRKANVSALIAAVYQTVHAVRPSAVFGVSPVGPLRNLRSEKSYFVDIDTWMSHTGYIDYVLPQIYFDFEQKTGSGVASDAAYATCLNSWLQLRQKTGGKVKLYVGLALYKCGTSAWDGNAKPEWLRRSDILLREVQLARQSGQVSGFGIYAYQNFDDAAAQAELANLRTVFQ